MLDSQVVPLTDLKYLPRNPKLHDIDKIEGSFDEFGFLKRIIVNKTTGHIIAGNGRVESLVAKYAAMEAPPDNIEVIDGVWLVPVDFVTIDAGREDAAALALNRIANGG